MDVDVKTFAILTMEADFCARINKRWKVVRQFLEFGLEEQIVTLSASRCTALKYGRLGLDTEPFDVRLIKINGSSHINGCWQFC
jgi:hypothetical protein